MATDGTKIIDSDLAHDTYWGIMDLYDSDASIEQIQKEIPFKKVKYGMDDDFYHEIFVTAYALAFWEIGEITDKILTETKAVIEKGVGVKVWSEENEKDGKSRKKELQKLLVKISQPNTKIRARKKYRKITNFHFKPDSLLAFKVKENYRAVVLSHIEQHRGECSYMLIPTTYKNKKKPTLKNIFDYNISGITIGSGYDKETTIKYQPGVESLWHLFPAWDEFFFGLVQIAIDHKDLVDFKDKFDFIGTLKIKDSFKKSGSLRGESSFKDLVEIFKDYDKEQKIFGYKKFPVKLICEA